MAVAKIDAHHPDVLLVEKSVSRFAQDYLLAKDISLVLNIKRPLLERVARCTGAQIVPSIDHLSSQKLGYCEMFHVEKFMEEHGSAGQAGKKLIKTLMFFDGCPRPFGCTVSPYFRPWYFPVIYMLTSMKALTKYIYDICMGYDHIRSREG